MKRIVLAVLGLFAELLVAQQGIPVGILQPQTGSSGPVSWTLVQGTAAASHNFTCNAGACATGTLSAVAAGNLELVLISAIANNSSGPALTGYAITGDSMTECSGFPAYELGGTQYSYVDCWYKVSATGGATSFTATPTWAAGSSSQQTGIQFIEVSRSSGSALFDTANAASYASCSSCAAPSLTLTGSDDYCGVWGTFPSQIPSAIGGSWTSPANIDNTFIYSAFFGQVNLTSYSAPNITQAGSARAETGAVCFK